MIALICYMLFKKALDTALARFEGSELNIISVPGEALCKECSAMYNVMRNEGKCPKCGSRSKKILGGQQFRVLEIGVAEPAESGEEDE